MQKAGHSRSGVPVATGPLLLPIEVHQMDKTKINASWHTGVLMNARYQELDAQYQAKRQVASHYVPKASVQEPNSLAQESACVQGSPSAPKSAQFLSPWPICQCLSMLLEIT
jgi:hypothetical protein